MEEPGYHDKAASSVISNSSPTLHPHTYNPSFYATVVTHNEWTRQTLNPNDEDCLLTLQEILDEGPRIEYRDTRKNIFNRASKLKCRLARKLRGKLCKISTPFNISMMVICMVLCVLMWYVSSYEISQYPQETALAAEHAALVENMELFKKDIIMQQKVYHGTMVGLKEELLAQIPMNNGDLIHDAKVFSSIVREMERQTLYMEGLVAKYEDMLAPYGVETNTLHYIKGGLSNHEKASAKDEASADYQPRSLD